MAETETNINTNISDDDDMPALVGVDDGDDDDCADMPALIPMSECERERERKVKKPAIKYIINEVEKIPAIHYITSFIHTLDADFCTRLLHDMNTDKPIFYGFYSAPCRIDVLKRVIGDNGYFFKRTTRACNVFMIWHERASNRFLFWGPSIRNVVKAMNAIRWRIMKTLGDDNQETTPEYLNESYLLQHQVCWNSLGEINCVLDKQAWIAHLAKNYI